MLPRTRKLKGIRDPASREVRSEFDQPRLARRSFSKAQAGYGALTLIKAPGPYPAVLNLNSRCARALRVDPSMSAEAAKKTDNSKAGRGKH